MRRRTWVPAVSMAAALLAIRLCWVAGAAESGNLQTRILVLTGNEYPGHNWRETAPWIAKFLAADPRLIVDLSMEPGFLASPDLGKYDAVVLNYLNWQSPDPGANARENLRTFIAGGKGLVLVHNAVAAFGDQRVMRDGKFVGIDHCGWPEVQAIFGRAWNPHRLHGHDPYGSFRVEITGTEHPITEGLGKFETEDELYTCLFSEGPPVEVLAKARSKVEGKEHPMVLVNHYGRGRVFLCVLGHDVKSLSVAPVQELYRRGTAWAAGLSPVCR